MSEACEKSHHYAILIGSSREGFLENSFHLISQPYIVSHSKPSPRNKGCKLSFGPFYVQTIILIVIFNQIKSFFSASYHEVYDMMEKVRMPIHDHLSFQEKGTNYTRLQNRMDFDKVCFQVLCVFFFRSD